MLEVYIIIFSGFTTDYMEVSEDVGVVTLEVVPNDFDLEPFMEIHITILTRPNSATCKTMQVSLYIHVVTLILGLHHLLWL